MLSLGSDPTGQLEVIAKKRKVELRPISMGQGQEVQARRLVTESIAKGGWVVINNSHLSIKFMNEIELMVDDIKERYRRQSGDSDDEEKQKEREAKEKKEKKEKEEKQDTSKRKAEEAEAAQAQLMGTSGIFSMLTPKQPIH